MNFTEVNTLTLVGNKIIVNEEQKELSIPLSDPVTAVQYHKGRSYYIEEPEMVEVPLDKYSYAFEEFNKEKIFIPNFNEAKSSKQNDLQIKFAELFEKGFFESSLGFTVDNRRYLDKNDKDNVKTMIGHMKRNNLSESLFVDMNNIKHILTVMEWETLLEEMEDDGLNKYQWKWETEKQIEDCTTIEELEAVSI